MTHPKYNAHTRFPFGCQRWLGLFVVLLSVLTACGDGAASLQNISAEIDAAGQTAIVAREVSAAQVITLSNGQRVAKDQLVIFGSEALARNDLQVLIARYSGVIVGQNPDAYMYQVDFPVETGESTLMEIKKALEINANIISVSFNFINTSNAINPIYPNDPVWTIRPNGSNSDDTTWNMKVINAPEAWGLVYSTERNNVSVGVIDGGFRSAGRDVHFKEIIEPAKDAGIISTNPEDAAKNNNHGMHVSGIIGADGSNGQGVSGVAWKNTNIFAARTDFSDFSVYVQTTRLLKKGVKVINFSVANNTEKPSWTLDSTYQDALESRFSDNRMTFASFMSNMLKKYDFLFVHVAGNNYPVEARFSGYASATLSDQASTSKNESKSLERLKNLVDLKEVRAHILSVGAVAPVFDDTGNNINLYIARYSQAGSSVEIAAPGGNDCDNGKSGREFLSWDREFLSTGQPKSVDQACATRAILSTFFDRDLNIFAGTSMAAPHVTGAAALIWQANPTLSAKQVKEILLQTAGGPDGHTVRRADGTGQSLPVLNLRKAVQKAIETSGITLPPSDAIPLVGQLVCGTVSSGLQNEGDIVVSLYKVNSTNTPVNVGSTLTNMSGVFSINATPGRHFLRFSRSSELSATVTRTRDFTLTGAVGPLNPINISGTCDALATTDRDTGIQGLDGGSNDVAVGLLVVSEGESYPFRANFTIDPTGLVNGGDYDFHKIDGTMTACTYGLANAATCHGASSDFSVTSQSGKLTIDGAANAMQLKAGPDGYGYTFTGTITGKNWLGTWIKTATALSPSTGSGTFSSSVGIVLSGAVSVPAPSWSLSLDRASITALGGVIDSNVSFVPGRNGVGSAAKFGGLALPGSIRIPNSAAMQFGAGGSFDMWARIDVNNGMSGFGGASTTNWGMALLAKSHDVSGVALMSYAASTELPGLGRSGLASFDASWRGCTSASVVPGDTGVALGDWFRVTVTLSSTTGYAIYVNKTLTINCPAVRPNFTAMNGQDLYLGKFRDSWYPLNGALQDLRIYPKALTAEEVSALP